MSEEGEKGLARATLRGTGWTLLSQLSGKGMVFVSTVLLARLLQQDDFGVAAYAITVIALFSALPTLGLGPALIYHRDDDSFTSTGFWLGMAAGIASFSVIWLLAPLTELLFGDSRAVAVTRTLALVFPIQALRNVHATLLRKRLAFRRRFVPEILQAATKGILSIALALAGFGAWSLIWGVIGGALAAVPAYWLAVGWRPRLIFDRAAAAELLPFGGQILAINSLGALVRNLDYLVVGRVLGPVALGVYVLAFRIPDFLIRNLCVVLGQVLLPVYTRVKDQRDTLHRAFVASTSYVVAITAPLAIGLSLVAEPLVVTAFSDKWRDAAPVLPPICLYALFVSLSFNLGDLFKAMGRPDVLTRLALLRAAVAVPALWGAAAWVGTPAAVGWAQAGVAFVTMGFTLLVARSAFQLPVGVVLLRLLPVLAACGLMAAAVLTAGAWLSGHPAPVELAVCMALGAAVYAVSLRLLARSFVRDGIGAVRDALARRRPAWEFARP